MIHDPVGLIQHLNSLLGETQAENERLREQLRIASEALAFMYQHHNLEQAWIVADDALTQMSLVE